MLNVVAYCRVSTEEDEQLNSLESQKRFFKEYIEKNLQWKFAGIYADEGISGTNTKKRKAFNQMIADAENKKFDLVLTKEISRFARNTLDSIFYTRKLKELGIGVFFMNDNINTLDPDAELRLTIMSSIAQEESRKTSTRVKWGQKRQMERGVVFGNGIYGYNLKDGKLTINEEQAKIVQLIFDLYLNEGMGANRIARELENKSILSPRGKQKWEIPTILKILKNEKYIGILKQKKYITVDYLSHKKILNKGYEDYVIIENNHKKIIEKEIFEMVQKEIARRHNIRTIDKSTYSNRYVWSGKIKCGYCGAVFKRKIYNKAHKNSQIVWQCQTYNKYGALKEKNGEVVGCESKAIREDLLEELFCSVMDDIIRDKQAIITELQETISSVIEKNDYKSELKTLKNEIEKIERKKQKLIELFTDNAINRNEFDKSNDLYMKNIEKMQQECNELETKVNANNELNERIKNIRHSIKKILSFDKFNDEVCKNVLEKIIIKGKESIEFYIKLDENISPFFIPLDNMQCLQWKAQLN